VVAGVTIVARTADGTLGPSTPATAQVRG
jgi:hypothetical protein